MNSSEELVRPILREFGQGMCGNSLEKKLKAMMKVGSGKCGMSRLRIMENSKNVQCSRSKSVSKSPLRSKSLKYLRGDKDGCSMKKSLSPPRVLSREKLRRTKTLKSEIKIEKPLKTVPTEVNLIVLHERSENTKKYLEELRKKSYLKTKFVNKKIKGGSCRGVKSIGKVLSKTKRKVFRDEGSSSRENKEVRGKEKLGLGKSGRKSLDTEQICIKTRKVQIKKKSPESRPIKFIKSKKSSMKTFDLTNFEDVFSTFEIFKTADRFEKSLKKHVKKARKNKIETARPHSALLKHKPKIITKIKKKKSDATVNKLTGIKKRVESKYDVFKEEAAIKLQRWFRRLREQKMLQKVEKKDYPDFEISAILQPTHRRMQSQAGMKRYAQNEDFEHKQVLDSQDQAEPYILSRNTYRNRNYTQVREPCSTSITILSSSNLQQKRPKELDIETINTPLVSANYEVSEFSQGSLKEENKSNGEQNEEFKYSFQEDSLENEQPLIRSKHLRKMVVTCVNFEDSFKKGEVRMVERGGEKIGEGKKSEEKIRNQDSEEKGIKKNEEKLECRKTEEKWLHRDNKNLTTKKNEEKISNFKKPEEKIYEKNEEKLFTDKNLKNFKKQEEKIPEKNEEKRKIEENFNKKTEEKPKIYKAEDKHTKKQEEKTASQKLEEISGLSLKVSPSNPTIPSHNSPLTLQKPIPNTIIPTEFGQIIRVKPSQSLPKCIRPDEKLPPAPKKVPQTSPRHSPSVLTHKLPLPVSNMPSKSQILDLQAQIYLKSIGCSLSDQDSLESEFSSSLIRQLENSLNKIDSKNDSYISENDSQYKIPISSPNLSQNISDILLEVIESEISTFASSVNFKSNEKQVDPTVWFLENIVYALFEEFKKNESDFLDLINTPGFIDPLEKLQTLQSSNIGDLKKGVGLEIMIPQEICEVVQEIFAGEGFKGRGIYIQMIFDCVNEALNYIRPFGRKGVPDPWISSSRLLFGEGDLKRVYKRTMEHLERWIKIRGGAFQRGFVVEDAEKLQAEREERMNCFLSCDMNEDETFWVDYDDEETQTKCDLTDLVLEQLVLEVIKLA